MHRGKDWVIESQDFRSDESGDVTTLFIVLNVPARTDVHMQASLDGATARHIDVRVLAEETVAAATVKSKNKRHTTPLASSAESLGNGNAATAQPRRTVLDLGAKLRVKRADKFDRLSNAELLAVIASVHNSDDNAAPSTSLIDALTDLLVDRLAACEHRAAHVDDEDAAAAVDATTEAGLLKMALKAHEKKLTTSSTSADAIIDASIALGILKQ